jgi:hypothetical protein
MSQDNIWLRGRREEIAALNGVLLAIDRVRRPDGTITPLRGAGAPQHRLPLVDSQATEQNEVIEPTS